ncbi:MAG: VOC family protein [Candidatus Velthaea sp.]
MHATAPKVSGIDATYYLAQDLERATEFYRKLFGAEPTLQMPGMVSEWTFAGGESFGLYKPGEDGGEFHPSGGVMFAVDDFTAAVDAHKSAGVKFNGTEDTPGCHMAFGVDSEGNGFILHKRK